jgi:ketosteroid isomerase-like protein
MDGMRVIAMDGGRGSGTLTSTPAVAGSRNTGSRNGSQCANADARLARKPASRERQARQAPNDARLRSKESIVAQLFDAFSRRDLLSALPLLHPEVVFQPMTAEVTRAGEPYRGHEGIRRYTQDIESHWDELIVQPAQIRAAGRAVVVLGLASGSGPAGSFENAPTTWVIKFQDGLVFGVQIFSDARHVVGALVGDEQG